MPIWYPLSKYVSNTYKGSPLQVQRLLNVLIYITYLPCMFLSFVQPVAVIIAEPAA